MGCKTEIFSSLLSCVSDETEIPEDVIASSNRNSEGDRVFLYVQRILGAEDGAAVERERELHVAVGDEPAGLQDNQPIQERASVGRSLRRCVPSGCAAVERGGSGIVEGTVHRRDEDRIGGEQVHVRVERERREEQGEAGGESGRGSQDG